MVKFEPRQATVDRRHREQRRSCHPAAARGARRTRRHPPVSHALEELVGRLTGSGEAGSWSASSWSRGPISTLYRPCPARASSDITALIAEIGAIYACGTAGSAYVEKRRLTAPARLESRPPDWGAVRITTPTPSEYPHECNRGRTGRNQLIGQTCFPLPTSPFSSAPNRSSNRSRSSSPTAIAMA